MLAPLRRKGDPRIPTTKQKLMELYEHLVAEKRTLLCFEAHARMNTSIAVRARDYIGRRIHHISAVDLSTEYCISSKLHLEIKNRKL